MAFKRSSMLFVLFFLIAIVKSIDNAFAEKNNYPHHHNNHSKKPDNPNKPKKSHQITYYELLELEREKREANQVKVRIKRNFPIAPDGFIPNSVVRKFFELLEEEPKRSEKKIWKLKWQPVDSLDVFKKVEEEAENVGQSFLFEWTSDDEKLEDDFIDEIKTDSNDGFDGLLARLKEYNWYKIENRPNFEVVLKFLVGKLIERNSSNHSDITSFILEILQKYPIRPETIEWLIGEMESELDGSDTDIISNNLKIVNQLHVETYNIDISLLNLLTDKSLSKETAFLGEVSNILCKICELDLHQLHIAISQSKTLHNSKYKKISDFKLKRFVEDLEKQNSKKNSNTVTNFDQETSSDTFKAILKEDWIAQAIKDTLKTPKDFVNFLIKSIKSVKSNVFFERICNYLHTLYNEFKLMNTQWETQIIEELLKANTEKIAPESLRIVCIDNLEKYFQSSQNKNQKDEILIELLRSAAFEKSRPQVKQHASDLLKKLTSFKIDFLNSFVEFYGSKKFNDKNLKLSWQELIDYYNNNPDISLNESDLKDTQTPEMKTDETLIDTSKEPTDKNDKKEKKKSKKGGKSTKIIGNISKSEQIDQLVEDDNLLTDKKDNILEEKIANSKVSDKSKSKSKKFTIKSDPNNTKTTESLNSNPKMKPSENEKIDYHNNTKIRVSIAESDTNKTERSNTFIAENQISVHVTLKETKNSNKIGSNFLPNSSKMWKYYKEREEMEKISNEKLKNQSEKDSATLHDDEITKYDSEEEEKEEILDKTKRFNTGIDEAYNEEDEDYMTLNKEHRTTIQNLLMSDSAIETVETDYFLDVCDEIFSDKKSRKDFMEKSTKDILDEMKKKVIINEIKSSIRNKYNELYDPLKTENNTHYTEKTHFIEPLSNLKQNHYSNMKFTTYLQNVALRTFEYTKLLECLIIRGLELHNHYQKLIPPQSNMFDITHTFVPIQYFNDFLIVHPYNVKKLNKLIQKENQTNSEHSSTGVDNINQSNLFSFDSLQTATNTEKRKRVHTRRNLGQIDSSETNSVDYFSIDHIVLIKKLLVSHGASNLSEYYSSLKKYFRSYSDKLNSKIPHQIIPLIWNDPVIQRLALVVSSAEKYQKFLINESLSKKIKQPTEIISYSRKRNKYKFITAKKVNQFENDSSSFELTNNQSTKLPQINKMESSSLIDNLKLKRHIYSREGLKCENNDKISKKKYNSHLWNVKDNVMKLQWKIKIADEERKNVYLPPLCLKATLNEP